MLNRYYFATPLLWGHAVISLLIFAALPISLLAPAVFLSTRLSSMASGVMMFMVFIVVISGGFRGQIGAFMNNAGLIKVGIITSLITPGDALYRLAISRVGNPVGTGIINMFGPFGSASTPSIWMLVYSLCYVMVLLLLAIRSFRNIDF